MFQKEKQTQSNNSSRFHNYLLDENFCNLENEPCLFVVEHSNNQNKHTFEVKVGFNNIVFSVDTGAIISCVSEDLYLKYDLVLKYRCLTFYNGTKVEPIGILNIDVE